MEDKKSFGEYIYKRRKEQGLTQKEFAQKLFVTEFAVSKWERGLSYPDITLIRDICKILILSEHELLTASKDMEARNAEKMAQKYVRMITGYKSILFIIYGI
jgi:transcriptional regulator with XRE-family HTH domain